MRLFRLALFASVPLLAAETTESVLARLDKESAALRQVSARIVKASYTAVLNDMTKESGRMWLRRSGKNVQIRTDIEDPEKRSYAFDGSTGEIYYPKINTVQIFDVGKSKSLVDQFLLLGFGSSGKELAKNYNLKAAGEDAISGRQTTRLELVPKSAKVLEQFKKIELWIPADAGYPVQQKFYQPGGDYYLISYSEVEVNPALPAEVFRLKLPADVKREYPQK